MTEKTKSQKVISKLKKELGKRKIGKVIGLDRNKQLEKAFNSSFK